ncbi:MAG: cold-shock protein [Desulfobulbus sp.]
MRVKGKVIKWKNDKGFGFIESINGMPDIFFHENSFLNQSRRPAIGEELSFEIATNPDGKQRAERILFRGERDPRQRDNFFDVFFSGLSIVFFICTGVLVFLKKIDPIILILYLLPESVTPLDRPPHLGPSGAIASLMG